MLARLIQFLFNVTPSSWSEGGAMRLDWLSLPRHDFALLVLAGTIAALVGIFYLYRREGKNLSAPTRISLAALRFIALLGVLTMLLEPAIVFVKREMIPSHVLVLVDRSDSMELKDAYADSGQARQLATALNLKPDDLRENSRLALAQRVLDGNFSKMLAANGDRILHRHDFTGQLIETSASTTQAATVPATHSDTPTLPNPDTVTFDRSTTAISTAVEQALAAYRGQPIAGVVVVTDGQSNTGDPMNKAAEAARAQGVPIYALAVGTPEGPRNARLDKIDISPVVFVRDTNVVNVIIESRGLSGQPANLILEKQPDGGDWQELSRKSIVLAENGTLESVPFELKEDRPVKLALRARIEDVGPELTTADNTALAEVRVVRQKIKVLFVAGHPFPEFEFIRNMLLRENTLAASIWLQTADKDYDQLGSVPLKRLPATPEELNDYDCVILYDPDPTLWPEQFPVMLNDFVGKAGGGLVYVAGERFTKDFFDHPDDSTSAWLPLLPVVSEPGLFRTDVTARLSAKNAWKLEITPEGHADPVLQFAAKPEENDRILASLPGMYWHYPVTRAKSGATVLARHADPRMRNEYGNHVLLATQLVGPGRSFFVGFDSTYRWRYLDEQTFDGFWARMIDRAGRSKQLGGRYPYTLVTDRATYRPGSQVSLIARFENPSDKDAGLDQMHGVVEAPDSPPIPITLTPRKNEPAAFEANFTVEHPGPHFIKVWAGDQDTQSLIRAATLEFPVELPNLEYDQPTLNMPVLTELAHQTGGIVKDLAGAEQLAAAIKVGRVAHDLEDRHPIFNAPILFGTVLLLVFLEWVLRKKFRLI